MAKQHYCFLKKFNNYFNRKIIKFENLSDYESSAEEIFIPADVHDSALPFDFNPNDNVTTEIIANEVPFEPDYFLLLDANMAVVQRWFVIEQKRNRQGQWLYQLKRDVIADNLNSLLNAPIFVEKGMLKEDDPFIVNSEGMSLNQIKQDELLITDGSKTAWIVGYMAKNAGGSDVAVQAETETLNVDYVTLSDIAVAVGTSEVVLNNFLNDDGTTTNKGYVTTDLLMFFYLKAGPLWTEYKFSFDANFTSGAGEIMLSSLLSRPYLFTTNPDQDVTNLLEPFKDAVIDKKTLWKAQIASMLGRSYYLTQSQLDILWQYAGKYVRYNGKFYKLNISESGTHNTIVNNILKDGSYSALEQTCTKTVELVGTTMVPFNYVDYDPDVPNSGRLATITSREKEVSLVLTLVSDSDVIPQLNITLSSGKKTTAEQEFDAFAIPLDISVEESGPDFRSYETYARRIASAIVQNQNAKIYDLQLLPYCPMQELISGYNSIDISNLVEHTDFEYIFKNVSDVHLNFANKGDITFTHVSDDEWSATVTITMSSVPIGKTGTIVDVTAHGGLRGIAKDITYSQAGNDVTVNFTYIGLNPSDPASFISVTVSYTYPEDDVKCGVLLYLSSVTFNAVIPMTSLNPYWNDFFVSKKTLSNCFMFRIVSPNYQGAFEFNVAKNGGSVESFNVFCTYKPYTPVIKVAPNFNWLYGMEYQDNRGLICGGDFSLPRITDEWRTYELNNKNYQNIFNREIQHLDFMQSIEMRNQLVSGGVGIFSDAVKGAGAGAMVGGAYGALAGAVVGASASAVGYAIDVDTMARTHRENKQLSIDKFNYQLGNIKALPYTLTKVGSFDVLSKVFPFVETYRCSDKELEAFENKIKYESMTVMRIGTLQEFMNFDSDIHYFKGSLIRNDEIADDTHILNAIYEELLKGVYI